jgi:hypothetical protein
LAIKALFGQLTYFGSECYSLRLFRESVGFTVRRGSFEAARFSFTVVTILFIGQSPQKGFTG